MSYLKTLRLEYDPEGGLRHGEPLPPSTEWLRTLDYVPISKIIDRMKLLWVFFGYALLKAKIEMSNPPATHITLLLSRCPRKEIDFDVVGKVKVIQLDLDFDPAKLLDIPYTAEALGEFALGCWEQAIRRLEVKTDFPAAFIREQMEKFRAQGYALENSLKPDKISGSKAKARIHGLVSCTRTVLKMEVAYRKKPLFERVIWDTPDQAFNIAYTKREFVVEDGCFKVREACVGLLPEAVFPLDSLPPEFLKTLT